MTGDWISVPESEERGGGERKKISKKNGRIEFHRRLNWIRFKVGRNGEWRTEWKEQAQGKREI